MKGCFPVKIILCVNHAVNLSCNAVIRERIPRSSLRSKPLVKIGIHEFEKHLEILERAWNNLDVHGCSWKYTEERVSLEMQIPVFDSKICDYQLVVHWQRRVQKFSMGKYVV